MLGFVHVTLDPVFELLDLLLEAFISREGLVSLFSQLLDQLG